MSNSAINFGGLAGMASIIGSIGNNPSINALSGGGAMRGLFNTTVADAIKKARARKARQNARNRGFVPPSENQSLMQEIGANMGPQDATAAVSPAEPVEITNPEMLANAGNMNTFNPMAQNMGMGIFGDSMARNRSLTPNYGSAFFAHKDERVEEIKARIQEIRADYEEERKEGEFYEDREYTKLSQELKDIEKEHNKKD
tara:strand:+ start:186 stop:785 length:600 start_codon:yes stop_codon:yes gene_type:complete